MIIYLLRRLLLSLVTLLILTVVSFSISYYPSNAPLSGAGLFEAYSFYISDLLHGEFGTSVINGQDIGEQLKIVFPATLELCFFAFIIALGLGTPLGIAAAMTKSKWPDRIITSVSLLGFSIPIFWLALLLMLFFSLNLELLPVSGRYDLLYQIQPVTGVALIDAWLSDSPYREQIMISVVQHLILPVITLAVAPTTEVIRLTRQSVIQIIGQNFIKAAATRGLSRLIIIRRHVLHNILPIVIPQLTLQFSTMLALAMITESVFNWPGLGRWLIIAIRQQDFAVISAGIMVMGSLTIVVNLIADIFSAMTNPFKNKEWYAFR
ncbi:putrescine export ABC transporter permease SapB [Pragia fontium]|uniref:Cationic peptide transport system permease protein n=2 Tax=Pragia fontium TaxID=82985 RepID=A0AAJ4WB60_9GAMM|nr:putrescine export ABC transporter permease SapB [Pragia fontium]AKJ42262.1 peptide ABC transporter permease [Pragia fontium]GKX61671.1 peptide transport system permease protein SapB [Pragia fontium]SFC95560.1 cationic peptide transport system permease protein [Pragia fontium DSM 5563 = ATCC 49100]VEJ55432.1 Peptide transport system permease protein sapB [Pragia fontium]